MSPARLRVGFLVALLLGLGTACDFSPIEVKITSPGHGVFTTASSILVTGTASRNRAIFQLTVNGVPVPIQPDKTWSTTIPLSQADINNPVFAELTRTTDGATWTDRIVVIAGDSVADGGYSPQSIALRLNDRALDKMEPLLESLAAASFDLQALLLAANPVATTEVCIIPDPFGGCLVSVTVVVNVTSASYASLALDVDSMTNAVAADIVVSGLEINYDTDGIDCQGRITSTTTDVPGDFELKPDAGNPTNIDVNLLGTVDVTFSGFNNEFTGGICDFPVVGDIITLIIGNVQPLVEQGFEDALQDPDGAGPADSVVAEGIESGLAGIELAGPIGEALGVSLETPLFDVFEDVDGVTLDSDSRITASLPDPSAPDLAASYHVSEPFPSFGPNTPAGHSYELALCVSTSAFNQLMKAEVESGVLAADLTEIDLGFGTAPITAGALAVVLPSFASLPPSTPMIVRITPTLAPIVSGNPGPAGELAELRAAQLIVEALEAATEKLHLKLALDFKTGLDLALTAGQLAPTLSQPPPTDITLAILENPIGENPLFIEFVLPSFLAPLLPLLGDSLGSFPLPDFLGQQLDLVGDATRNGEFMSLFTELVPVGTLFHHDYTAADFQSDALTRVGDAFWVTDNDLLFLPHPDRLRLTSNGANLNGSAWYDEALIYPSKSWSTTYRFQVSHLVGAGADGIGFHVQSDGLTANPDQDGAGLANPHLSVVVDTWNNGPEGTDESLKVILNGSQIYFNDLLDFAGDPNPGSSSSVFRMEVGYHAPTRQLRVALFDEGGPDFLDETIGVDLSHLPPSHAGFSARTGGQAENHDVRTWTLAAEVLPAPTVLRHDYTGGEFQTAELALVGDAFWTTDTDPLFQPLPNRLRLTNNGANLNGSAWYDGSTIDATRSWSTTYRFQLSFQGGAGADGIGFHIQGDGLAANPDHEGGGLTTPHLTVAVDTWNNGPEGTDESLKVQLNGSPYHFNDLLDFAGDPNPGSSPTVFRMELDYDARATQLRIRLFDEGGTDYLDNTIVLDLGGFPTSSHVGFSARTGTFTENHDVRSWSLEAVTP